MSNFKININRTEKIFKVNISRTVVPGGGGTDSSDKKNISKILNPFKSVIQFEKAEEWFHALMTKSAFDVVNDTYEGGNKELLQSFEHEDINAAFSNPILQKAVYDKYKVGSMFQPYTRAALLTNQDNLPSTIEFGSHYGNAEHDNATGRMIGKRHDITSSPDIFLTAIACGCRVDDTQSVIGQTSYGYGIEFVENNDYRYIRENFTARISDAPIANAYAIGNGTHLKSDYHKKFAKYLQVGDTVYYRHTFSNDSVKEKRTVIEIVSNNEIIIDEPFSFQTNQTKTIYSENLPLYVSHSRPPVIKLGTCSVNSDGSIVSITNGTSNGLTIGDRRCQIRIGSNPDNWKEFDISDISGNNLTVNQLSKYEYNYPTGGEVGDIWIESFEYSDFIGDAEIYEPAGQFQSWAVPIICAKFNAIRYKTGVSWDIVREAARITAKKSGKISETEDWDMFRGFGYIDVDSAVSYIQKKYFSYPENTATGDVNANNVGVAIDNFTLETAPQKTQYVALGGKKKTLISALIALFKLDFDALYSAIGHNHDSAYSAINHNHNGTYQPVGDYATNSALSVKADLKDGKVPASQLPSFVDDVVEVANYAALPTTGESGKIYVTLDTNLTYRWTGSGYAEISASLALGETSSTAYRGDRGKESYDLRHSHSNKTILDSITEAFDTSKTKTTPVDADSLLIRDSADSSIWKRITWAAFKTLFLQTVNRDNSLSGNGTGASPLSNNMFNWRAQYGCELFTDLSGAVDVFDHWYYRTGNNTSTIIHGNSVDGRVGIQALTTLASATNRTYFTGGVSAPAKYPINGAITSFRCGIMIPALSDGVTERFCVKAGFCGDGEAAFITQNNGSYFLYDEKNTSGRGASTQWKCISANGNTVTGTNNASGVTVSAGTWYDLMVVVDAANTNAKFYINGTLVDTHTANIFTGAVSFAILLQKSDGTTARLLNVDYFGLKSVFNTSRF